MTLLGRRWRERGRRRERAEACRSWSRRKINPTSLSRRPPRRPPSRNEDSLSCQHREGEASGSGSLTTDCPFCSVALSAQHFCRAVPHWRGVMKPDELFMPSLCFYDNRSPSTPFGPLQLTPSLGGICVFGEGWSWLMVTELAFQRFSKALTSLLGYFCFQCSE